MKQISAWVGVVLLSALAWGAQAAPASEPWPMWQASQEQASLRVDHSLWQDVLNRYLDDQHASGINRFAYGQVHPQDVRQLDAYIRALTAIDPRQLSRAEQKAYWINLYNAVTVQLMLKAWPVSSIRKLGAWYALGPWDDEVVVVAGQGLTLNDIEHRILRPIWQDARIHYAVNCASLGCPNLASQAFTAENTERLLEQAAREFINHPRGVQWQQGRWQLSSIYDWYSVDFPDLAAHLAQYADASLQALLKQHPLSDVRYDYEWAVNAP
ncbi:DUF547 domain-containing protein [Atopomonas sediminilitoris]|uniref:DUF547 domain-containing protein n=1 Tax=Atopomonas sediminilitoris TaxID=2919919 RepID=UPI001F4D5A43|nr:DUF547 domain-containing protein [Atopomonas sediminilitoris]MCJ8168557.1 DUF547 domain-containing protein [Atopomonas sediminilitoris]